MTESRCPRANQLVCLCLLLMLATHTEPFAKEGSEAMTSPAVSRQEPARVVLEGVPRTGWGEGTPIGTVTTFPMALWACMQYLGEDYPVEYIFGASGAAF